MPDKHVRLIQRDEHMLKGGRSVKKTTFLSDSYYQNTSLVSGYYFYGFAVPGSNPTQAVYKLMREELDRGIVLYGDGSSKYSHQWSASSLASISFS